MNRILIFLMLMIGLTFADLKTLTFGQSNSFDRTFRG